MKTEQTPLANKNFVTWLKAPEQTWLQMTFSKAQGFKSVNMVVKPSRFSKLCSLVTEQTQIYHIKPM